MTGLRSSLTITKMLLAIDIGNTNITLGLFSGENLTTTWRISADPAKMPDEYCLLLCQLLDQKKFSFAHLDHVVMCSVVPTITPIFEHLCQYYLDMSPLVVDSDTDTGITILYERPSDVGADRIVDAAAAMRLYGGPIIIVDIGTATVFDAVTEEGLYLGGAIAPGLAVAADSLFRSTSQLRRVGLRPPPRAIGTNTPHAMQSGLVFGYCELITGMIQRFKSELHGHAKVVATGGLVDVLEKEVKVFDIVNPDLTLQGLRIIYELNRDRMSHT